MSLDKALASATSIAADCLGLKMGRIAEGYEANLVMFRKIRNADDLNPENVVYVVRKGKLYDPQNLKAIFS